MRTRLNGGRSVPKADPVRVKTVSDRRQAIGDTLQQINTLVMEASSFDYAQKPDETALIKMRKQLAEIEEAALLLMARKSKSQRLWLW